jgi:hypothetical protein
MQFQTRSIAASKCISELHNHGLQMHLQTRSITASKCISEFNLISASKCISKLAQSQPPSVSLYSHDAGLQTCSITISECISQFTRLGPPSVSPNTLDYRLLVHLQTRSITASECISEFTQSSFSGEPRIALKHCLQPVQIYCV